MGHRELFLVLAIGLPAISALGGAWVGAGWVWDAANAAGFVAAALLIYLHVETGAARSRPAAHAAFYSRLHNNVALLALVFVAVHVVALLVDDATTFEYWKLSAPHYMLAGIVAIVLMTVVTATAYTKPRRALFTTPARFRRVHGIASLVLTLLVAWHIAGSAFYFDTTFKAALCVIALVVLPTWWVRRSADHPRPASDGVPRSMSDARRETWRLGAVGLSIAVVFSVLRNLPSLFRE
jgi:hypothetical protein